MAPVLRRIFRVRVLVLTVTLIVLAYGAAWWVFFRDEAPPYDEDLRVVRRNVAAEENGFPLVDWGPDVVDSMQVVEVVEEDPEGGWRLSEETVLEYIDKGAGLVETLEQAMDLPEFQFPEFTLDQEVPFLLAWHRVAYVLTLRVSRRLAVGQDRRAFDDAWMVIRFGRRIQGAQGPMRTYQTGVAIESNGVEAIVRCLEQTRLTEDDALRLVAPVLELNPEPEMFAETARASYLVLSQAVEYFRQLTSGEGDDRHVEPFAAALRRFFLKPNQMRRVGASYYRGAIALVERGWYDEPGRLPGGWVGEKQYDDIVSKDVPFTNSLGRTVLTSMLKDLDEAATSRLILDLKIRGLQTVLAVRRFEVSEGRLPRELTELVPKYLGDVPRDPFGGGALRFSAENRWVYSIGDDFVDEGGSAEGDGFAVYRGGKEPTFRLLPWPAKGG